MLIAQTRVYPLLADVVAPLLLLHLDEGTVQLLESFASHHVGRQCVAFVFRVDRSTFAAKEFVLPSAIVLRESIDVCHVGTDIYIEVIVQLRCGVVSRLNCLGSRQKLLKYGYESVLVNFFNAFGVFTFFADQL